MQATVCGIKSSSRLLLQCSDIGNEFADQKLAHICCSSRDSDHIEHLRFARIMAYTFEPEPYLWRSYNVVERMQPSASGACSSVGGASVGGARSK